jgi:hypothetical protein
VRELWIYQHHQIEQAIVGELYEVCDLASKDTSVRTLR